MNTSVLKAIFASMEQGVIFVDGQNRNQPNPLTEDAHDFCDGLYRNVAQGKRGTLTASGRNYSTARLMDYVTLDYGMRLPAGRQGSAE